MVVILDSGDSRGGDGLMVWGPGVLLGAGPEIEVKGKAVARGQAAVGTQNSLDVGGFRNQMLRYLGADRLGWEKVCVGILKRW